MLRPEHITQFQELYKQEFGEEINREEAHEKGIQLVRLMQRVYKPMSCEDWNKVQQRRQELGLPMLEN